MQARALLLVNDPMASSGFLQLAVELERYGEARPKASADVRKLATWCLGFTVMYSALAKESFDTALVQRLQSRLREGTGEDGGTETPIIPYNVSEHLVLPAPPPSLLSPPPPPPFLSPSLLLSSSPSLSSSPPPPPAFFHLLSSSSLSLPLPPLPLSPFFSPLSPPLIVLLLILPPPLPLSLPSSSSSSILSLFSSSPLLPLALHHPLPPSPPCPLVAQLMTRPRRKRTAEALRGQCMTMQRLTSAPASRQS